MTESIAQGCILSLHYAPISPSLLTSSLLFSCHHLNRVYLNRGFARRGKKALAQKFQYMASYCSVQFFILKHFEWHLLMHYFTLKKKIITLLFLLLKKFHDLQSSWWLCQIVSDFGGIVLIAWGEAACRNLFYFMIRAEELVILRTVCVMLVIYRLGLHCKKKKILIS